MSSTDDEMALWLARRRRRSVAIGLVLGALALLFFAITVGRMSA
ncbi:hypothetical protein [Thermaurantiacus sp.]